MKKTKVTLAKIEALKPCQDRLNNYIKFYDGQTFTVKEFLALENITHQDKLWVAFRLIPKTKIRFAAGEIAKSVLHIYEEKHPNDLRPRNAIKEALRLRVNKPKARAAAYAAYAAANAAYAAANAAYAAYAAAAYAAYAAYDAAYAAYAAANAAYAAYAAYAAADAAYARKNQEQLQIKIILKYWK